MKTLLILMSLMLLIVSGCAYPVKPHMSPAIEIYNTYEEKIPGTYILNIDDMTDLRRTITPSSVYCSAHNYPIQATESVRSSIEQTMKSIFENIIIQNNLPSQTYIKDLNVKGTISVQIDSFYCRVQVIPGSIFRLATCNSTSKIEIGVRIRGKNKLLFATSVGDSSTADGTLRSGCGDVAQTMCRSIEICLENSLEHLAERISNCPRLRE